MLLVHTTDDYVQRGKDAKPHAHVTNKLCT